MWKRGLGATAVAGSMMLSMVGVSGGAGAAARYEQAGQVTFALTEVDGPAAERHVAVELWCSDADEPAAEAFLVHPDAPHETHPHDVAGEHCTVEVEADPTDGRVDEIGITVRQAGSGGTDHVWGRTTVHSEDGVATSSGFVLPAGDVDVELTLDSLPADEVGTPLRMMAFNIWDAGMLVEQEPDEVREANLQQLVEFVSDVDPDVLFLVETYGSGTTVVDGLNALLPPGADQYTGVQVTVDPDLGTKFTGDNLWLVTRLDIEEVYPRMGGGDLTSFNFGGARLGLPDGSHIHAFSVWLHHTTFAAYQVNQSALEAELRLDRTYTDEELLAADETRRIGMASTIVNERLASYIGDDDAPVFLGGDFNALSHLDWTEQFADVPGYGGLALPWPAMRVLDDAGFTDTYRHANPDAGRYPGRTFSPHVGFGTGPVRIDYILARGDDVRMLGSHTRPDRLEEHQGSNLVDSDRYPFYSDHGTVVSDVLIRGSGDGVPPGWEPPFDEPEGADGTWPNPPDGTAIPAAELTAEASSENPGSGLAEFAVDGDMRTHWHSQWEPEPIPQPHHLTIDMQRVRTLSGVRYQPRIVGNLNGTILRGTLQASLDGETYTDVADLDWERTAVPKDILLDGIEARYLRFHIEFGIGGHSAAAAITPYEQE